MTIEYNLKQLKNIYNQSIEQNEHILVFELIQGRGRFIFLMFFSHEDKESKDILFMYLRNCNKFLSIKLYGSHRNGDFKAYFTDEIQKKMIEELQLNSGVIPFVFEQFLERLSARIPQELGLQKIEKLKEIWPQIKDYLKDVLDQPEKTTLFGIKHLPINQKPQHKTLRKLYMYTNSDGETIRKLTSALFSENITLLWTNNPTKKAMGLVEVMNKILHEKKRDTLKKMPDCL